jgi:hypothetical protein
MAYQISAQNLVNYFEGIKGLGKPFALGLSDLAFQDSDGLITQTEYDTITGTIIDVPGQYKKLELNLSQIEGAFPSEEIPPYDLDFKSSFDKVKTTNLQDGDCLSTKTRTIFKLDLPGPGHGLRLVRDVRRDDLTGEVVDKDFFIRLKGEGAFKIGDVKSDFGTRRPTAVGILEIRKDALIAKSVLEYGGRPEMVEVYGSNGSSPAGQLFQQSLLNDNPATFQNVIALENPFLP